MAVHEITSLWLIELNTFGYQNYYYDSRDEKINLFKDKNCASSRLLHLEYILISPLATINSFCFDLNCSPRLARFS